MSLFWVCLFLHDDATTPVSAHPCHTIVLLQQFVFISSIRSSSLLIIIALDPSPSMGHLAHPFPTISPFLSAVSTACMPDPDHLLCIIHTSSYPLQSPHREWQPFFYLKKASLSLLSAPLISFVKQSIRHPRLYPLPTALFGNPYLAQVTSPRKTEHLFIS